MAKAIQHAMRCPWEVSFSSLKTHRQLSGAKHTGGQPSVRDSVENTPEVRECENTKGPFHSAIPHCLARKGSPADCAGKPGDEGSISEDGGATKAMPDEAWEAGAHAGFWEHTAPLCWESVHKQSVGANVRQQGGSQGPGIQRTDSTGVGRSFQDFLAEAVPRDWEARGTQCRRKSSQAQGRTAF